MALDDIIGYFRRYATAPFSVVVLRHGLAAETASLSIKNSFCRLFLRPSRC
jgi:hypothetical protein